MQGGNTPQYRVESPEAVGEQEEWIRRESQTFCEPKRTGEFDYTVISGPRGRKEEKRYGEIPEEGCPIPEVDRVTKGMELDIGIDSR
jgi:hypothetical protein